MSHRDSSLPANHHSPDGLGNCQKQVAAGFPGLDRSGRGFLGMQSAKGSFVLLNGSSRGKSCPAVVFDWRRACLLGFLAGFEGRAVGQAGGRLLRVGGGVAGGRGPGVEQRDALQRADQRRARVREEAGAGLRPHDAAGDGRCARACVGDAWGRGLGAAGRGGGAGGHCVAWIVVGLGRGRGPRCC